MNLISNSDYISTSALYGPSIQHGLISRIKHRYVRREGTPGKYRYIYPEDLKARREARRASNTSGATLFGDSRARRRLGLLTTQQRRFQAQATSSQRKADRAEAASLKEAAKAADMSRSESYRRRHARKRDQYASDQRKYQTAVEAAQTNVERGKAFIDEAQAQYDASRTIDELKEDVLDIGRAFIGAFTRGLSSSKQSNSDASHEPRRPKTHGKKVSATPVKVAKTHRVFYKDSNGVFHLPRINPSGGRR